MGKYNLTATTEGLKLSSESEIDEDTSTSSMLQYGLRNMCTDTEYHLANRLNKLRCVALELIVQLDEDGYKIDPLLLQYIDVEVDVVTKKRLTL